MSLAVRIGTRLVCETARALERAVGRGDRDAIQRLAKIVETCQNIAATIATEVVVPDHDNGPEWRTWSARRDRLREIARVLEVEARTEE